VAHIGGDVRQSTEEVVEDRVHVIIIRGTDERPMIFPPQRKTSRKFNHGGLHM
jgi:hypothetical protein